MISSPKNQQGYSRVKEQNQLLDLIVIDRKHNLTKQNKLLIVSQVFMQHFPDRKYFKP